MGLWKMLANIGNSEGIREAMRMSYDKHYRLAQEGRLPNTGDPLHSTALFGALASRLRLSGVDVTAETEPMIWMELLPFTVMDEKTGREALAEYVVYRECPGEARTDWLRGTINKAVRRAMQEEDMQSMLLVATFQGVGWAELCDEL